MKAVGLAAIVGLASGSAGAQQRSLTDRHGPMRTGFTVEVDGREIEGFRSVTIPSSSTQTADSGDDGELGDLEMEREVGKVDPHLSMLWEWHMAAVEGRVDEARKEIAVTMLDEEGEPQIRWEFEAAWVGDYDPPDLDASADGDVATESVTISGFNRMVREEV